jgi:hypothetical protein
MKLLSIQRARSLWFVNLTDLNPRGHYLLGLIPSIIKKYRFQIFPAKPDDFDLIKGIKLLGGAFHKELQHDISIEVNIFNNGLFADTRSSTEDSDAFLDEFLTWMAAELDLVPYQEVLNTKVYVSELWVQTDKSMNTLNPKLTDFAKRLTSLIVGHENHPIAYETTGIYLWTNPIITNPPATFRFERVEGAPFNENRYYSAAPLQTNVHLEILTELESILSS